jgi:hypothetical protein
MLGWLQAHSDKANRHGSTVVDQPTEFEVIFSQ